jgi:PAS domain S-box-containing protein
MIQGSSMAERRDPVKQAPPLDQQLLPLLLHDMSEAVVVLDHDQQVVEWNPAAEQLYGVPSTDAVGRQWSGIVTIHPADLADEVAFQAQLLGIGSWRGVQRHHVSNGRKLFVDVTISRLAAGDGRDSGLVLIVRTVQGSTAPGTAGSADRPGRAAPGYGCYPQSTGRTEPGHLSLEEHSITYMAPLEEALIVTGDELRLEQVLQNLIQNAVKYSPQGGAVTVHLERRGNNAIITVSDQGIGIPEREIANLFQRFYRVQSAAAQHNSGIGVGLYIVKEIVAAHDGTIDVTSIEAQGSSFRVLLPLVEAAVL